MRHAEGEQAHVSLRLDTYLTLARLTRTRSLAKALVDGGRVARSGSILKAAHEVRPDDVLEIHYDTRYLRVRVVAIPQQRHHLPARRQGTLYEVLSERPDEFFR